MNAANVRVIIMTRRLVEYDEGRLIRRIPHRSIVILMYTFRAKRCVASALRCLFGGAQNSPMNEYCVDRDAGVHIRRRAQEVEWLLFSSWVKRGCFLALSRAFSSATTSAP
jgi:hypothetical protein